MLEVDNLSVEVNSGLEKPKLVVDGVSLTVKPGEVHAVMGPNGSGKSSLLFAVAGHPRYRVTGGRVALDGEDLAALPPDARSLRGLLMVFQTPVEVPGVRLSALVLAAYNKRGGATSRILEVRDPKVLTAMRDAALKVGLDQAMFSRDVNVGFSGGERKRSELFQVMLLKPKYILLDEPDSGLDVDGVRAIAAAIKDLAVSGTGVLLVTHYARILGYVSPDRVSLLVNGRLVESDGPELAERVEREGYAQFRPGGARA